MRRKYASTLNITDVSCVIDYLGNTILQHPVALCRSDFIFHYFTFCHLYASSINVHPSYLFTVNNTSCFSVIGCHQIHKLCV
jgi:hypothetical protein